VQVEVSGSCVKINVTTFFGCAGASVATGAVVPAAGGGSETGVFGPQALRSRLRLVARTIINVTAFFENIAFSSLFLCG